MPRLLEAQSTQKFAGRNANQLAKDPIEMKRTQICGRGQIFQSKRFMEVGVHGLDRPLDGQHVSSIGTSP